MSLFWGKKTGRKKWNIRKMCSWCEEKRERYHVGGKEQHRVTQEEKGPTLTYGRNTQSQSRFLPPPHIVKAPWFNHTTRLSLLCHVHTLLWWSSYNFWLPALGDFQLVLTRLLMNSACFHKDTEPMRWRRQGAHQAKPEEGPVGLNWILNNLIKAKLTR